MVAGAVVASLLTIRFHQHSDLLAAAPVGPATRAVIFVVDGLRPADLTLVPLPHIHDLQRHGVTYDDAWVGQSESVGPASNATLSTGLFPRNHGVIGLQWSDPQTGTLQRPTNERQVRLGSLDQVMEAANSTPLAALLKRRYPRARVLSVAGSCADADAAASWLGDYVLCPVRQGKRWQPTAVTGHSLPAGTQLPAALSARVLLTKRGHTVGSGWGVGSEDSWVANYAITAMRRVRPLVTVINFPELEAREPHLAPGNRNAVVARLLRGIDREVGEVVAELRSQAVANQTVFVLTSDQAESQISVRLPMARLRQAVTAAGGNQVYIDPGELALVGLQNVLQAQPVAQAVQDEHLRGVDAIYFKTRSGASWTYQAQYIDPDLSGPFGSSLAYSLGTMASPISADVVVACAPGTALLPGGNRGPLAMGLGVQWDTQHIPLIIAGHGVTGGVTSNYPARLVDVMPTLARLMWLTPARTDGVPLADSMAQPVSSVRAAQNGVRARLLQLTRAMQARRRQPGG